MARQTFKMFLEASAGDHQPKYDHTADDEAIKIIETKCKDAIPMILADKMIYRGDKRSPAKESSNDATKAGAWVVDTSATERKSQNTTNHYTVILDNHPAYKSFPKRSRSFICSTDWGTARGFSPSHDSVLVVIPFDGTKIGICNDMDLWDTTIKLFGQVMGIRSLNRALEKMGVKDNFNDIVRFSNELAEGDPKAVEKFEKVFGKDASIKGTNTFLDEIFNALMPDKIDMTHATTATLGVGKYRDREVWVGGKVLLIAMSRWHEFRKYFLEKYKTIE